MPFKKSSLKQRGKYENIKSELILKKVFNNLNLKKKLLIIKYNKRIKKRLNININDYENFYQIEIEIIPYKKKYDKFINIIDKEKESFYHIYFNDNNEEVRRYNLNSEDNVEKIKIIIDKEVTSFSKLFKSCYSIKLINFKKFYRKNITDMSYLFGGCSSLQSINFNSFNTSNVINMSFMFNNCSSLKELDLSKFNTNKVINMTGMFFGCSLLNKLNISNFNTLNVIQMSWMFYKCNLLKNIKLSNFLISKDTEIDSMLDYSSIELKNAIRAKNKKIN